MIFCLHTFNAFIIANINNFRHNQLSDLHKQNLEVWRSRSGPAEDSNNDGQLYRDRARERRVKHGEPEDPKANKSKDKIGSDNIGRKMLERMGWTEGLGLGKSNQGRADIVEVSILLFKRKFTFIRFNLLI